MDIERKDYKANRKRRRLYYSLAVAIVVSLGVVAFFKIEPAAPNVTRSNLWIDTVRYGEMIREVRGPGVLQPTNVRWIAAQTDARVDSILVRAGTHVEAGTVLMLLSNPELQEEYAEAASALAAAEAEASVRRMNLETQILDAQAVIASTRVEYEIARLQAEAQGELAEKGIIPAIEARRSSLLVEQLARQIELQHQRIDRLEKTIKAQLAADEARNTGLGKTVELRRARIAALEVRANSAGILHQVMVEEGQQVARGTNLTRIAGAGQLIAELRVPETEVEEVTVGQRARIDTRSGVVPGIVTRIDPAVIEGAVLVDIEFTENLPTGARPDLSIDGVIEIERVEDVLYVGRPAHGRSKGQVHLFKVGPSDDSAQRVLVTLGRTSSTLTEVVGGLDRGDKVVVSDTSRWDKYDRIRLN